MKSDGFLEFVLDQLSEIEELTWKRMFGGFGLYLGESFFAILSKDCIYFKTDGKSRNPYLDYGMGPFQPNEKQTLKNYYEVPVDVLENAEILSQWARIAAGIG